MEVIHLLFVEEDKQQSNAWCDSYRSILNHFDTAISSWKGFNYLSFIIYGLKKFNTKSQDELHSQIEIIQKIDLKKRQYPPLFSTHCYLLSAHCYLLTVPPVNSLKHGYLHERASPRY